MNFEPSSNVVDVYVGYLRNKIDKPWDSGFIKTMRGHGYMLDVDHSQAPTTAAVSAASSAAALSPEA
jgi:DNA-binding winged helix-turn-helix (wHTH) protein